MNRLKQLIGEGRAIFVFALCLLTCGLLAPSAWAGTLSVNYTIYLKDGKAYDNYDWVNETCGTEVTKTVADAGMTYADGVWTMKNFTLQTTALDGIWCVGDDETFSIKLVGENAVTSGSNKGNQSTYGLCADNASLVIYGSGSDSLTVTAGDSTEGTTKLFSAGISAGSLLIRDATVTAIGGKVSTSAGEATSSGICVWRGSFVVLDATVTATGGQCPDGSIGVEFYCPVTILGKGKVLASTSSSDNPYGVTSWGDATEPAAVAKDENGNVLTYETETGAYLVNGSTTAYATKVILSEGGVANYSIHLKNGKAYLDQKFTAEVTSVVASNGLSYAAGVWTMKNYTFTTRALAGLDFCGDGTIDLQGVNAVTAGSMDATEGSACSLLLDGLNMVITGNGSLAVTAMPNKEEAAFGIACNGSLTVTGGAQLKAVSHGTDMSQNGLTVSHDLMIGNATVEVSNAGPIGTYVYGITSVSGKLTTKGSMIGFGSRTNEVPDAVATDADTGAPLYFAEVGSVHAYTNDTEMVFCSNVLMRAETPPVQIKAMPTSVDNATFKVYADGVETAGPDYLVWSNGTATVVYRADRGYCFANGQTVVTNKLDTSKDPAVLAAGEVAPSAREAERTAKAVYVDATKTMTFYYDRYDYAEEGVKQYKFADYPKIEAAQAKGDIPWKWNEVVDKRTVEDHPATNVTFDASFADYAPKATGYWLYKFSSIERVTGIENLNTSSVTNMQYLFAYCTKLASLDVSGFDTSKVENFNSMFSYCAALDALDVSGFDTAAAITLGSMFTYCESLKELDVRGFNTANCTNTQLMFNRCASLRTLDVSRFNTAKVTRMAHMFHGCKSLKELDVSGFETACVTNMYGMFLGCSLLTELDLSRFDTREAQVMENMFKDCSNLKAIYASRSFTTDAVTRSADMFTNCTALVGGKGTMYDVTKRDKEYARIDGGPAEPGYFTARPPNYKTADGRDWLYNHAIAGKACPDEAKVSDVDLFYVYPTLSGGEQIVIDGFRGIEDETMRSAATNYMTAVGAYVNTARCFADMTHVYAPFYRQATLDTATDCATNAQGAVVADANAKYLAKLCEGPAYSDVTNALSVYFAKWNKGRKLVLAAHSQGSAILRLVMENYFTLPENQDKAKLIVCSYQIGFGIGQSSIDKITAATGVKFAEKANDTNVIVSYNTMGEGTSGNSVLLPPDTLAINPITWTRSYDLADKSLNLGALTNALGEADVVVPHLYGAQVAHTGENRGEVVECKELNGKVLDSCLFGTGSLHVYDYSAYWENLRANAQRRITINCERSVITNGETKVLDAGTTYTAPATEDHGGVFYLEGGAKLVGTNASFVGNSASSGGAIYNNYGEVNLAGAVLFSGNTSKDGTGGALITSGNVTIDGDVTFTNNAAIPLDSDLYGGAVEFLSGASMTVLGKTVFACNRSGHAGAVNVNRGCDLHFAGETLWIGNAATRGNGDGGALYNKGEVTFDAKTVFSGNSAKHAGGAIYNWSWNSAPTVTFRDELTLATDTDTIYNKTGGTLVWDLTEGGNPCLNGYQCVTNENGTLKLSVDDSIALPSRIVIATGDLSNLAGKDTFVVFDGTVAAEVTVNGKSAVANGIAYRLATDEVGSTTNLVLSVCDAETIAVDSTWADKKVGEEVKVGDKTYLYGVNAYRDAETAISAMTPGMKTIIFVGNEASYGNVNFSKAEGLSAMTVRTDGKEVLFVRFNQTGAKKYTPNITIGEGSVIKADDLGIWEWDVGSDIDTQTVTLDKNSKLTLTNMYEGSTEFVSLLSNGRLVMNEGSVLKLAYGLELLHGISIWNGDVSVTANSATIEAGGSLIANKRCYFTLNNSTATFPYVHNDGSITLNNSTFCGATVSEESAEDKCVNFNNNAKGTVTLNDSLLTVDHLRNEGTFSLNRSTVSTEGFVFNSSGAKFAVTNGEVKASLYTNIGGYFTGDVFGLEANTDYTYQFFDNYEQPVGDLVTFNSGANGSYSCKLLDTTVTSWKVFEVDGVTPVTGTVRGNPSKGGTTLLTGGKITVSESFDNGFASTFVMDADSTVSFGGTWRNGGEIVIDLANATKNVYTVVDHTSAGSMTLADYGTVTLINNPDGAYKLMVEGNDLIVVRSNAEDEEESEVVKPTLVIVAKPPRVSGSANGYTYSGLLPGDSLVATVSVSVNNATSVQRAEIDSYQVLRDGEDVTEGYKVITSSSDWVLLAKNVTLEVVTSAKDLESVAKGEEVVVGSLTSPVLIDVTAKSAKFTVGANATYTMCGMMRNVASVKVAAGKKSSVDGVKVQGITEANLGALVGTSKLTTGSFSDVTVDYLTGTKRADALTIGSKATFVSGEIDTGDGVDKLSIGKGASFKIGGICDVETVSVGSCATGAIGDMAGLKKLTVASGKAATANAEASPTILAAGVVEMLPEKANAIIVGKNVQVAVDGVSMGAKNDKISIGDNTAANLGTVSFGGGKDSIVIGKNAEVFMSASKESAMSVGKFTIGKGTTAYLSSELIERGDELAGSVAFGMDATIVNVGTADVAKYFSSLVDERADDKLESSQPLMRGRKIGWLSGEKDAEGTKLDEQDYYLVSEAGEIVISPLANAHVWIYRTNGVTKLSPLVLGFSGQVNAGDIVRVRLEDDRTVMYSITFR